MDELRNTPERTPATDVDKGIEASSPVKPLQPATSGHKAEEVAQRQMPTALQDTLVGAMWNLLEKTEEIMDEAFPKLPRMPEVQGSDSYAIYLNILSDIVHKGLDEVSGKPSEEAIHFFDTHNIAPKNHPTGTTSRPDFLAIKIRTDDPPPLEFEWSALEATGEVLSGSDKEKSRAKTAAYTSYLLQARPDRVTVQGIYVDPSSFRLIVSNACGAFVTDTLDWKSRPYRLLLCAWIWRLYEPIVDPSITANIEQDKPPTFNITIPGLPETVYRDCTIYSTGTAFGRRTIVLSCPNPEIVIKEQYVETSRRFEEGPTLAKIHGNGTFPGVVRPGWHGSVGSSKEGGLVVESEESQRKKTRVILLDKAPSIMDAKTPREALVAMYDLLEITRFLHKKRKILHRDISASNVRIRDVVPPDTSSADNDLLAPVVPANTSAGNDLLAPVVPANTSSVNKDLPPAAAPAKQSIVEELQEMCFASYLLRTKCNSSPGRLDTRVLLIDFDMSEDQEPGNQGDDKNAPQARTGTPIFIARAVASGMQKKGDYTLKPMPQLDQESDAYKAYKAAVPDRLEAFPPNKVETFEIPSDKPHTSFKHKLQYDAESVFWLLLWWAMLACPAEDTSPDHKKIDQVVWAIMTGQHAKLDPRGAFFVHSFPSGVVVHPDYGPLETLLEDMARQLRGDHEQGEDRSRKQDDYLHEAFQRLILDFLFTHYDKSFMTAQKGPNFRKPAKLPAMEGPLSSHQINKTRASGPSSSHNVRLPSSRSNPSHPSLKRKHSDKDPSSSDPNDETYKSSKRQKSHKRNPF